MEEIIGYVVIVCLVALLIGIQINVYLKNKSQIKALKQIFPNSNQLCIEDQYVGEDGNVYAEMPQYASDEIDEEENFDIELEEDAEEDIAAEEEEQEQMYFHVLQINLNNQQANSPVFSKILSSINNYLVKNKGAVSDFSLVKDIVERNCDAKEEEVDTQVPIPLYIGLMGTMLGIIVGIGSIVFFGDGFASFLNDPAQAIGELMGGVAIAMIASLSGIVLTTLGSWSNKESKTKLEDDKNVFYSWIQAELLPMLSDNIATTLQLLQKNLQAFNLSFEGNVRRMDAALSNISKTASDQTEMLKLIQSMDIKKLSEANVRILREFSSSANDFKAFADYMKSLNGYLDSVNNLSNNVNTFVESNAIVQLGKYFQEENDFFQDRRQDLNKSTVGLASAFSDSLATFKNMSEENVDAFAQHIKQQRDRLESLLAHEAEEEEKLLSQRQADSAILLQKQEDLFNEKVQKLDTVLEECKALSSIKKNIEEWSNLMKQQNRAINELNGTIAEGDWGGSYSSADTSKLRLSKIQKIVFWTISGLVSLAAVAVIVAVFVYLLGAPQVVTIQTPNQAPKVQTMQLPHNAGSTSFN